MGYTGLAIAFLLLALVVGLVALRLLFNPRWILAWLRGTAGLALLIAAAAAIFLALDVYSYQGLDASRSVATLSFKQLGDQHFEASVVDAEGVEHRYELKGDQWQLDVRLISWSQGPQTLGLLPGFRLDRLSGRYLSLEQERHAERSVHGLSESRSGFDLWQWMKDYGGSLDFVRASYGSAVYLPMADGALFSVRLTDSGLEGLPLNERATRAVDGWMD